MTQKYLSKSHKMSNTPFAAARRNDISRGTNGPGIQSVTIPKHPALANLLAARGNKDGQPTP